MTSSHENRLHAAATEAANFDEASIPYEHLLVASATADALAAKFELPRRGIRTIPVTEDGETHAVVIHTGTGLRRGSWNDIHAPEHTQDFRLDIGGVSLDSRAGMSFPAYEAMYRVLKSEARVQGRPCMPDKLPKDDPRYEERTWTWLTAYTAVDGEAPIGQVRHDGDVIEADTRHARGGFEAVRFRPAITIGHELVEAYFSVHPDAADLDF
jgi:hypothetical protein